MNSAKIFSGTMASVLLFAFCLGCYALMAYGGIRTADGEIVYRTGEALATTGSLALDEDMAGWRGFAVATGVDGRLYSVFAPGQSILMAPFIRLGLAVNQTRWYESGRFAVPVSFTVDEDSLKDYFFNRRPAYPEKHARRFVTSFFNAVVTALVAVTFFFVLRHLAVSIPAALAAALLLGLATPLWSYAGTMFKEPLTMLWTLVAFDCLIRNDPDAGAAGKNLSRLFLAGLWIGLGFFTHTTVILFVPFFFAYGVYPFVKSSGHGLNRPAAAALVFIAGFSLFTSVFCWLNYTRFGSILQTGRSMSPVAYGAVVAPWEGLAGLLVSPGKGLLLFCPIVLAGIVCWPRFHPSHRFLSTTLVAMIAFRWVFISCFSDWHGGFCLGPRHLLPVVPFFLIPVAFYLSEWFAADQRRTGGMKIPAAIFFSACVIQQIYFCLGEPISFYYLLKQYGLERGVSIISDNSIYFQWRASPLFYLLEANRGPFLLKHVPLDNYRLFLMAVAVMALTVFLIFILVRMLCQTRSRPLGPSTP
ncbi:MAG: hypothetical protein AB1724_12500 [Thermodesulfobacteriota bacterium]